MKKITLSIAILLFASIANAQQKPSDRPLSEEIKKVKAKQAERNVLLNRQPGNTTTGSTPSRVSLSPVVPAHEKPSAGPVRLPAMLRKQ